MGLTGGAATQPAGGVPWATAPECATAKAIINDRTMTFGGLSAGAALKTGVGQIGHLRLARLAGSTGNGEC